MTKINFETAKTCILDSVLFQTKSFQVNGFKTNNFAYRAPILVTAVSIAVFTAQAPADTGHHMFGGWGSGHMTFGIVPMALFWLALIVVIVTLVRWGSQPTKKEPTNPENSKTAVDILKERYARGEIDLQEFEKAKKILLE